MYMNVITTRVHRRVVSMHTSSSKEAGLRLRGNMQKRIRQKTTLLTYFQRGTTLMLDMKYFNRAYKRRLCGCIYLRSHFQNLLTPPPPPYGLPDSQPNGLHTC